MTCPSFNSDTPTCHAPVTNVTHAPTPETVNHVVAAKSLAFTGFDVAGFLVAAVVLLVIGVGLVILSRREA